MGNRLDFHEVLKSIPGVAEVHFQPPTGLMLEYPCIVYERDREAAFPADDLKYRTLLGYSVTVIDPDPDSQIPDYVSELKYSSFADHFKADQLNHDVYRVFY